MNGTTYIATTLSEVRYEGDSLYWAIKAATKHTLATREKTYVQETKPGEAPHYVWTSRSLFRR